MQNHISELANTTKKYVVGVGKMVSNHTKKIRPALKILAKSKIEIRIIHQDLQKTTDEDNK